MKIKFIIATIFLLSCLMVSTCFGHKITVFGYVDGDMIKTESTFSGGRVARNCKLSMARGSDTVLIGETNDKGMLDFPVPQEREGFDLIVVCGDGHRGTWRIESEEFLDLPDSSPKAIPAQSVESVSGTRVTQTDTDLRQMFRQELAAELSPIKRQLAELRKDSVSLADIMGGLGYILGLAGLASYMRYRKHGK
jgi:nickel transport protein